MLSESETLPLTEKKVQEEPGRCQKILRVLRSAAELVFITRTHTRRISPSGETEHLQYTRLFLLSGLTPLASIRMLVYIRGFWLGALGVCLVADFFVYDSYIQPRQDHVAWIMFPSNWLLLLTFLYLVLCMWGAATAKHSVTVFFETPPTPFVYLVLWNLYNLLLPLNVCALIIDGTTNKSLDKAYVTGMAFAFCALAVELILGTHLVSLQLFTMPVFGILFVTAYSAVAQFQLERILYASLDWKRDLYSVVFSIVRLIGIQLLLSAVCYVIIASRTRCMGIKSFKCEPKPGEAVSQRSRMFDISVLFPQNKRRGGV